MAKRPPDSQQSAGDGPLTPDDEAALDRAWATITDADIAASIRWLARIESERQRQQTERKEMPDGG